MKNSIKILLSLIVIWNLVFIGCKKSDSVPDLTLDSLKTGTIDLYGATSATGVPVGGDIVATCNTNVTAATATSSNISLKRGTVDVDITVTVSGKKITIHPASALLTGTKYTLVLKNLSSDSNKTLSDVTSIFTTTGVGLDTPPQAASQVMYLQLNGNINDVTGNATKAFEQITYTTDRFGTANAAASFNGGTAAGNGDIVELSGSTFINASTTLSVWFKVANTDYAGLGSRIMFGMASERGMFLELGGDLAWMKFATDHKISPDPKSHYFGTAWDDPNGGGRTGTPMIGTEYKGKIADLIKDKWSQLVMTFDALTSTKTIFINGVNIYKKSLVNAPEWTLKDMAIADKADGTGAAVTGIDPKFTLGFFCSRANTATGWTTYSTATNTFKGSLDDFRIYNKALTDSEVTSLYNSEKAQ